MLNTPKNDNTLLNVRSGERFGHFFIAISLFITISPHLNVFYKLGKGNAVYESNVFETKSHAYIKHFQV